MRKTSQAATKLRRGCTANDGKPGVSCMRAIEFAGSSTAKWHETSFTHKDSLPFPGFASLNPGYDAASLFFSISFRGVTRFSSCPALCRASTSCVGAATTWMAGTSPAMTLPLTPLPNQSASGFGLIWKCTAIGVMPNPPSWCQGTRSPLEVHRPRPFQPIFASSMRPSRPLA